ncbi:MAG: hypothetical protein ACK55Z_16595, partial [bacterium]
WYHSHADPIWPDGTFKGLKLKWAESFFNMILQPLASSNSTYSRRITCMYFHLSLENPSFFLPTIYCILIFPSYTRQMTVR